MEQQNITPTLHIYWRPFYSPHAPVSEWKGIFPHNRLSFRQTRHPPMCHQFFMLLIHPAQKRDHFVWPLVSCFLCILSQIADNVYIAFCMVCPKVVQGCFVVMDEIHDIFCNVILFGYFADRPDLMPASSECDFSSMSDLASVVPAWTFCPPALRAVFFLPLKVLAGFPPFWSVNGEREVFKLSLLIMLLKRVLYLLGAGSPDGAHHFPVSVHQSAHVVSGHLFYNLFLRNQGVCHNFHMISSY